MNQDYPPKLGFDSPETKGLKETESKIQLVEISKEGGKQKFILLKYFPTNPADQPHRNEIKQLQMIEEYRNLEPQEFVQYTVIPIARFENLLKRVNEISPKVSTTLPRIPEKYDQIDDYTINQVHKSLSDGIDITLYFHPSKQFFLLPSHDLQTPELSEAIQAAEIISIAHKTPAHPLVDINSLRKISYDPNLNKYSQSSLINSREPEKPVLTNRDSLFISNSSIYSLKEKSKN